MRKKHRHKLIGAQYNKKYKKQYTKHSKGMTQRFLVLFSSCPLLRYEDETFVIKHLASSDSDFDTSLTILFQFLCSILKNKNPILAFGTFCVDSRNFFKIFDGEIIVHFYGF